jgi:hypothetical protein
MADVAKDKPPQWSEERPASGPRVVPSWLAPRRVAQAFTQEDRALLGLPTPQSTPPMATVRASERSPSSFARASDRASAEAGIRAILSSLPPSPSSMPVRISTLPEPHPEPHAAILEALRGALTLAIADAARARRDALAASEADLVALAAVVAQQIVGREIRLDPGLIAGWAREGLAALGEQDEVVVAIAPNLAELVPEATWAAALPGAAPPLVDPSLPPSGCEIRGRYGRVDAGVTARIAAVIAALEGECR